MSRGSLRIIGGVWRRNVLPIAPVEGLRPTPDRVRETLFNWLGQDCSGWRVLDLFAGTGALGFEAASRGAAHVRFVEQHREVVKQLQTNKLLLLSRWTVAEEGEPPQLEVDASAVQQSLIKMAVSKAAASYDLIALDPPFGTTLLASTLPKLQALLKPNGLIYIEWESNLFDEEPLLAKQLGVAQVQVLRHLKAGKVHAHLFSVVTM